MSEARARKRALIWCAVSVAAFILANVLLGLDIPGEWLAMGGSFAAGLEAASWEGWIKGHKAARGTANTERGSE